MDCTVEDLMDLGILSPDDPWEKAAELDPELAPAAAVPGTIEDRRAQAAVQEPPMIDRLKAIKSLSDQKAYADKHARLRALMQRNPEHWAIDSELDRFYGVTHQPTGFRFHMPKTTVPHGIPRPMAAPLLPTPTPALDKVAGLFASFDRPPAFSLEPLVPQDLESLLAKLAADSWYLNAARGHVDNLLAGRGSIYQPGEGIMGSVARHLGTVRARGDRAISEAQNWDRMQNAMDPNRALRQLQGYVAGTRQPLVSHPLDRLLQGDQIIPRLPLTTG